MRQAIYDQNYFRTTLSDETLGDVWGAVGSIGSTVVGMLPSLFGGGGSSAGGPARGLAAITQVCQQALQSLGQLPAAIASGQLSPAAAVAEGERILAALSNPQYVYQAQRGNDAAVLNDAKAQGQAIVNQLRALAGSAPAGSQPVVSAPSGGTSAGASPAAAPAGGASASTIGGIDTNTLLLIGGLGLAVVVLTR